MTVLTITVADQTFDKRSSEVNYLTKVIDLIQADLQKRQGTNSGLGAQNVLGQNQVGVANAVVATYTYIASTPNP
jgi:hypothetical protein